MPVPSYDPVRVAIVNDYELIVSGVAALLAPHAERVVVVERLSQLPPVTDVDVVLYDTFTQDQGTDLDVEKVLGGAEAKLVVFSWNTDAGLVARALRRGAAGYIAKSATAAELVDAILRVHGGEVVRPPDLGVSEVTEQLSWPGQDAGLTAREAEIIALVSRGLSNQEMADKCFLSPNTIKSHIRLAYRKMGVTRRAEAVRWGIEHGLHPDVARHTGA